MSYVNENSLILGKPSYSSVWPFPSSIGPLDNVTTTNLDVTTINGLSYPPPPGTGFVTLTGVETLSNKSLIDNSTFIIDVTDASKRIGFDAAGTASTTLTLRATQSANRTYTMADMGADTNFMFTGGTQTVTGNKSFSASTLRVVNSTDASVYTTFTTGTAPAGTVATISTSGLAASRTYNLVDAGGTTDFVLTGGTQTLTGTKIFPETARMARAADTTTYMRFTPGASPAGTVTTIATAVQSGSRTYTIPDSSTNTEFVLAASSQTLSNKNFQDSGTFIVDIVDPTIRIGFDAAGATGSTLTLRTTNTTSRTYTMPDMGANTSFVFTEGAQTLSSKALDDATTTIVASGGTATIAFNSAGTAGTSTTIRSTQTASSVFSFPNTTTADEIVLADATQNLTNKGFASDTTYFYNPAVPTKRISFDPSGLNAGVTYTIRAAAGAASRVFSLPNTPNDTFAFLGATQTLTNKTITGTSNNVSAASLRTATGAVTVSAATAPTAGQVLTATSATVANWQTPTAAPTTFSDSTFAIYDNVDNTTQILFDAAGTTATTATIRSAQTASRIYTIPDASADDSFVLLTPTQTLTNKTITSTTNTVAAKQLIDATGVVDVSAAAAPSSGQVLTATSATTATWQTPASAPVTFSDAVFAVYDSVDNTKQINFDAAGTAATTATIRSAQTASRIYTIPDAVADDSFVLLTPAQTLTNKTLTLPVIASISNGGTITIPSGTDTLVGRDTTDTFTNKTITSTTNTVAAKQLINATGVVSVSASAAPTAGQTLVASSATVAAWATPSVTTVTGILPVANGGTGVNTLTSNGVLVGAGTSAVDTTKAAPTGAFVGTTDVQSLTNKSLADNTTNIYAASNNTILIGFDAGGTASTKTTFVVRQTANRNINFVSGGVNCNALLSEGAQTVNGVNTFTAGILTPTITETVANAGTAINSVNVRTVVSAGVNVGVIEATAANSYLALLVTGTGAITAQIPNSAVSGGNVRGTNAVDFQMVRSSATFVAAGTNSGILCGNSNRVAAAGNAVIGGGNTNLIGGGATNSGILCGLTNTINSNILQGVICGGARNTSGANFSGVLAGDSNSSNGARSAVGGGNGNTAGGSNSFVGGGDTNTANSTNGFVGAGSGNLVSGARSSIPGGLNNTASGADSTVLYGASCTATASYTVSGGNGAQSTAAGALTIVDSQATTTTNGNIDRAVMRFNNGYRFITGPTAPIRVNNVHYKYTNLQLVATGAAVGNNNFTNGDISMPAQFSARYIVRVMGVQSPSTTAAFNPAPLTASYHIAYDEGVISGDQVAGNSAVQITSITNTRSTNSTVANIQNSVLNNTILTFPYTFRVRMNIPGAFGLTMVWTACVDLYINDYNSPDPV